MKFKYELDYFENINARREHYEINFGVKTDYQDLNAEERSFLMKLNEHLKQIEVQFLPIMNAKGQELQKRVDDSDEWMREFNLMLLLTFYLRENDPEYDEDDDNILMQIEHRSFDYDHPDRDWGFGVTDIHYCEGVENYPGEKHCYLYHQLYGHCSLDWRDLLRIGCIYVEIKTDEQSWVDVPTSSGMEVS